MIQIVTVGAVQRCPFVVMFPRPFRSLADLPCLPLPFFLRPVRRRMSHLIYTAITFFNRLVCFFFLCVAERYCPKSGAASRLSRKMICDNACWCFYRSLKCLENLWQVSCCCLYRSLKCLGNIFEMSRQQHTLSWTFPAIQEFELTRSAHFEKNIHSQTSSQASHHGSTKFQCDIIDDTIPTLSTQEQARRFSPTNANPTTAASTTTTTGADV